jgi:hypothetical protein
MLAEDWSAMLDALIAAAIFIAPVPDQAQAIRSANITAARQARQIPPEWEPFTLCISERESGYGNDHPSKSYLAKNPASSASGRYQFLDGSWRKGGAWNVWKRLIRYGYDRDTATYVRQRLMATPIRYWRPVYQDVLYAEVLLSGEGKGWRHWHLAGSPCNRLTPT